MSTPVPNLMFSHMGFAVSDLPKMEDFYTRIMGFTVTDRGEAAGMNLVFLSRDPVDHHQLVLVSGRPDNLPPNPFNPQFGSLINQISFRVGSLDDLRQLKATLEKEKAKNLMIVNHGISWSIYCHDPDGNNLELFVDTEWYFPQPFLLPLELSEPDDVIKKKTLEMAKAQPGFQLYDDWRKKIGPKMHKYMWTKP